MKIQRRVSIDKLIKRKQGSFMSSNNKRRLQSRLKFAVCKAPMSNAYKKYKAKYGNKLILFKFRHMIGELNARLVEDAAEHGLLMLPFNLGYIAVTRFEFNNGKRPPRRVDYNATKKLWAEDPQASLEKVKVYIDNVTKDVYRWKYLTAPDTEMFTRQFMFIPSIRTQKVIPMFAKENRLRHD
jgi:hypothetical protein